MNKFSMLILSAILLLLVSYTAVHHFSKKLGVAQALDNLSDVCYNNMAIVEGTKKRYFLCQPIRLSPEELRQLGA